MEEPSEKGPYTVRPLHPETIPGKQDQSPHPHCDLLGTAYIGPLYLTDLLH